MERPQAGTAAGSPAPPPPPLARTHALLTRELGEELVVFDRLDGRAHALNRAAALVWRACDGSTSAAEIAARLATELAVGGHDEAVRVVRLALDRLDEARLLERRAAHPERFLGALGRREVLGRLAAAGVAAALLPAITSIAAPVPAMAATVVGPCDGCYTIGSTVADALEANDRAEAFCAERTGACTRPKRCKATVVVFEPTGAGDGILVSTCCACQ
jgi:PqqD family protein of HPr-rel-A system